MRDWSPFRVCPPGQHAPGPRAMESVDGVVDRLRAAAFAELQAREAFLWAADRFDDAPADLKAAWRDLAREEDKHLGWLLKRLSELGADVADRPVSARLWDSFVACASAEEFARYMASAEERGQRAGERFAQVLAVTDPISANIFAQIAREETTHIALAERFFPGNLDEAGFRESHRDSKKAVPATSLKTITN